jgi:hypothetical protein
LTGDPERLVCQNQALTCDVDTPLPVEQLRECQPNLSQRESLSVGAARSFGLSPSTSNRAPQVPLPAQLEELVDAHRQLKSRLAAPNSWPSASLKLRIEGPDRCRGDLRVSLRDAAANCSEPCILSLRQLSGLFQRDCRGGLRAFSREGGRRSDKQGHREEAQGHPAAHVLAYRHDLLST